MKYLQILPLVLIAVFTSLSSPADVVRFLANPQYDLDSRVSVIEAAQKEIYFQVYVTGTSDDQLTMEFLGLLYRAANDPARPNLKVYIVLDALAAKVSSEMLYAMSLKAHGEPNELNPRMNIRLFNQYRSKILKPWQLDHRMHNKLLVADGKYAIVGGRNMSQEYYDLVCADTKINYIDTDVLMARDSNLPDVPDNLYQMSETEVSQLSSPEIFQWYAHTFFTRDTGELSLPKPMWFLSGAKLKSETLLLNATLDKLNQPGAVASFEFVTTLKKGTAEDKRCAGTKPWHFPLGEPAREALEKNLSEHGAEAGKVTALYDPPYGPLVEHAEGNLAMKLEKTLVNEFSKDNVIAMRTGKVKEVPQLIIVSPYIALTGHMKAALKQIYDNIAEANKELDPSERTQLDLQIVTNADANADVKGSQYCFNKQALPQYLDLHAKIFEYAGELDADLAFKRIGRIHQKMYVVNRTKVFIGSFNSDYRSSNLNLELGAYFDLSQQEQTAPDNNAKLAEVIQGVMKEINEHLKKGAPPEGNLPVTSAPLKADKSFWVTEFCREN